MGKKSIVIGATGTIGTAVASALEVAGHEVVRASRKGPIKVDLGQDSAGGTAVSEVARAYVEAVEGTMQGQTILP